MLFSSSNFDIRLGYIHFFFSIFFCMMLGLFGGLVSFHFAKIGLTGFSVKYLSDKMGNTDLLETIPIFPT